MRSDSLLVLDMTMREARNCRDAMLGEIEKGIRRRKSTRESYVRNMWVVLRMLLKSSSNVSIIQSKVYSVLGVRSSPVVRGHLTL